MQDLPRPREAAVANVGVDTRAKHESRGTRPVHIVGVVPESQQAPTRSYYLWLQHKGRIYLIFVYAKNEATAHGRSETSTA